MRMMQLLPFLSSIADVDRTFFVNPGVLITFECFKEMALDTMRAVETIYPP